MRFILKVIYNSANERFEIGHSTKMFNAGMKDIKEISPKHLREFEGNLVYNMKANAFENSWEIVYMAQDIVEEFKHFLKWESINYLYRHYDKLEGEFKIPMVESIGTDNFYEIQIIDTKYPVYNNNGTLSDKTLSKIIYSFTFSAKEYIPLKAESYLPSFYNLYKKGEVLNRLVKAMEKKKYANRFDCLPDNEVINLN